MNFQMLINVKIKKNIFLRSGKPRMLFYLLINVKMPTIVGIFTFMNRKKNSCSAELCMKYFYNIDADTISDPQNQRRNNYIHKLTKVREGQARCPE